jgi:uncharacterized protein YbjT (DUF2867 family)
MEINAIIFGATGHIGQGVLIECLEHPDVKSILIIVRKSCGIEHGKVREIIHEDFHDYKSIEDKLSGYNACFFCLGTSSMRMKEEDYRRITQEFAVEAAEVLSRQNNDMTFCFISGAGTDETEKSRMMWARVKGRTENALKEFPFKSLYLMRPAYIQPMKGVKSSLKMYNIMGPLYPVWRFLFPKGVTNTVEVGQAMINAVLHGYDKQTLENSDIIKLGNR